jgi:predicted TIM-barrel fold metal-dependent hydrolase
MNPSAAEPIIDPDLPIIDAHHHLWHVEQPIIDALEAQESFTARALAHTFRRFPRYLSDELVADLRSGHNVRATVFVDSHIMYRRSGPPTLQSVGEIEFVNGIAAMAESGFYGELSCCAGIVGGIDLTLADAVADVLEAHMRAGGARYRGIRAAGTAYDADDSILMGGTPRRLHDPKFREGFKWLGTFGLSCDVLLLEPQLPELLDLARAFPETQIILNHLGGPVGIGSYAGQRELRFPIWQNSMRALSSCSNVAVKLGGLGNPFGGFPSFMARPPATSTQLASEWRPYIESSIEAFGVQRCMFESNFPVDSTTCSYAVLWNAFKRVVNGASADEKSALFSSTAARIYRLTE